MSPVRRRGFRYRLFATERWEVEARGCGEGRDGRPRRSAVLRGAREPARAWAHRGAASPRTGRVPPCATTRRWNTPPASRSRRRAHANPPRCRRRRARGRPGLRTEGAQGPSIVRHRPGLPWLPFRPANRRASRPEGPRRRHHRKRTVPGQRCAAPARQDVARRGDGGANANTVSCPAFGSSDGRCRAPGRRGPARATRSCARSGAWRFHRRCLHR